MGKLLSYSGISTKIRAMQSKLITEDQIQEMLQFTSTSHAAAWLKRTPEYSKTWASLDENSLHRGQIEKLLKASIFNDFSKIYQFASSEQRKFLDLYSRRYEIRVLKELMTNLFDHRDTDPVDLSPYREFFRRHSNLDLDALTACKTMDEFINALKGNEFYSPLSQIQNHDTALLFDYGMALDLYYFSLIWKVRRKLFSGKDLEQITKAYGEKFDMLNLQFIQRSKRCFQMEPAAIYALLVPMNYKLRKEEITSSITRVSSDEFLQGSVSNPLQLLQGKVAGLGISKTSGNPSGELSIMLRGISTLAASSAPLIVIDGVAGGSLNAISPEDIESIDVLKDGSAAAIYGTRGTNGVIIINTKRPQSGRVALEYKGYVTIDQMLDETSDYPDATELRSLKSRLAKEDSRFDLINDFKGDTDWVREITRTPVSQTHYVSLQGGNARTNYLASVTYNDKQGIYKGSFDESLTAKLSINHAMFDDRFKIALNVSNKIVSGSSSKWCKACTGTACASFSTWSTTTRPRWSIRISTLPSPATFTATTPTAPIMKTATVPTR